MSASASILRTDRNQARTVIIELRDSSNVLDTDTVTAPTLTISKDGGAFAGLAGSPSCTNIAAGFWKVTIAASDLDYGYVILKAVKAAIITTTIHIYTNEDVEDEYSVVEALRIILSSAAGKLSGAGTGTVQVRDILDSKNRITATVDDDGNRTAVSYDVT